MELKCDHLYGHIIRGCEVTEDNYELQRSCVDFVRFTYCPFCRTQLHNLDGSPIGLPNIEDDCIKGGCED